MDGESDIFLKESLGAIYLRISVMVLTNLIRASAESCETVGSSLSGVMLGILFDEKFSFTGYSISFASGENGILERSAKYLDL
ncbi:hypothetical protein QUB67_08355 [Microcoleus sp. ARI1-A1]